MLFYVIWNLERVRVRLYDLLVWFDGVPGPSGVLRMRYRSFFSYFELLVLLLVCLLLDREPRVTFAMCCCWSPLFPSLYSHKISRDCEALFSSTSRSHLYPRVCIIEIRSWGRLDIFLFAFAWTTLRSRTTYLLFIVFTSLFTRSQRVFLESIKCLLRDRASSPAIAMHKNLGRQSISQSQGFHHILTSRAQFLVIFGGIFTWATWVNDSYSV